MDTWRRNGASALYNSLAFICVLLVFLLKGTPVVTDSPMNSELWICHRLPMCGDKIYNPLEQCCFDESIVPLNATRNCGPDCIFWPCHELCCPENYGVHKHFGVKLKILGAKTKCSSHSLITRFCSS